MSAAAVEQLPDVLQALLGKVFGLKI